MPQQDKRPTYRELDGKLKEAKNCIKDGRVLFCDPGKALPELFALGLEAVDVWAMIDQCLEEIEVKDYAGSRPPQRSYETAISGQDLFAFAWDSNVFGMRMYLKFVIKNSTYYYVSLHKEKGFRK